MPLHSCHSQRTTDGKGSGVNIGEQIAAVLKDGGIPCKDSWFGGSTGHATFYSFDHAKTAGRILQAAGFTVRGPVHCIDYKKESDGRTRGPSDHLDVYRIGLRI